MTILWKFLLVCCIYKGNIFSAKANPFISNDINPNVEPENKQLVDTLLPLDSLENQIKNSISNDDLEQLLFRFQGANENSCLLDNIKSTKRWWTFPNGTLRRVNFKRSPVIAYADMSNLHISSDEALCVKFVTLEVNEVVVFSAAYNNLTSVPQKTLSLISASLKYLTLSGNKFSAPSREMSKSDIYRLDNNYLNSSQDNMEQMRSSEAEGFDTYGFFSKNDGAIAWARFPHLPNLLELDVSNCQIESVTKDVFRNLTNLRSLYISHNKLLAIPFDTFFHVPFLQYLDLSHTNPIDYSHQKSKATIDGIVSMVFGLKIQQTTFKYLPNLMYLDLSHTRVTRNSAVSFAHFSEKLKYLSLCYTTLPIVNNALFKNTTLVGLDLSGNTYAAYSMTMDAFESISETLNYLYFERSNLKDISWIKRLKNVKILSLAGNNINTLTLDMFSSVESLQVLDLGGNHIGNWYAQVFANNNKLRVLNLRENNINIITSEMLKDFSDLDYLSIGNNNFVCDCMLRELVELATLNSQSSNCSDSLKMGAQRMINSKYNSTYRTPFELNEIREKLKAIEFGKHLDQEYISSIMLSETVKRIKNKIGNTVKPKLDNRVKFAFSPLQSRIAAKLCPLTETPSSAVNNSLNGFRLKFELLDYDEEEYWCFNETEKTSFAQLSCNERSFVDEIAGTLHNLTTYIISSVCTVLVLCIIGLIIYFKWWHICYYYSYLKSAALLSAAVKENVDKLNTMSANEPNMLYDIFISYSQNDREWVLTELMPNIEEDGDIKICLHERDFQIGVTILDNIISCMDRSRALMLIISSSFLLSHWCQFEMHLAQHRIFDTSHNHLMLVFLEDIPRHKRPKHLQYLMDVKTYIKWPGAKQPKDIRLEDHKLFWKRLRRSLNDICN